MNKILRKPGRIVHLRAEKLDEDMDFTGILLGFQHGVTIT